MSEPRYLSGDATAYADDYEDVQELECECGYAQEYPVQSVLSHGIVTWYAQWQCPECGEKNSREDWYDPSVTD